MKQITKVDHEVVRGTLYIFDTQTREKLVSLDIDEIYNDAKIYEPNHNFPIEKIKEEFQNLIYFLEEQNIYLNDEKTALEDVLDYAKL